MTQQLTRQGALNFTETLDRVATTVQKRYALLGLPEDVALDFAKRADMIADAVEIHASRLNPLTAAEGEADTVPAQDNDPEVTGVDAESGGDTDEAPQSEDQNLPETYYSGGKTADEDEALLRKLLAEEKMAAPEWQQPAKNETGESVEPGGSAAPHWDANAIGDDRGGPYKADGDEPYMAGEFSQERFHQLRDKQQAGQLPGVDAKLASVTPGNTQALQDLGTAMRMLLAAETSITKLPGFSPMQLRAFLDRQVALRHEIEKITSQYESVLKQLKDLEKEESEGAATMKKAAAQMREKGQYLAETETALLKFTAYLQDKVPGIEQMIARGDEYKGQKAGDFFGRIATQLGDDIAQQVQAIYEATKEDLTHTTMAVRGLKIVEKTASFDGPTLKQAGMADIVVSIKEWLAGKADAVASRILGFTGDIAKWFKGYIERTKIVKKNAEGLISDLAQAQKDIDAALATSKRLASDATASEDDFFGLTK